MVSKLNRNGSVEDLPMPSTRRGWKEAGSRYTKGNRREVLKCRICSSNMMKHGLRNFKDTNP